MKKALLIVLLTATALLLSCAGMLGGNLVPREAPKEEVTGTYRVILYGGRHGSDIETLAYLDREGDEYEIAVNAPDFDYKVKTGLPADEALKTAIRFVGWHEAFMQAVIGRLADERGNVIGYEVKPLYRPLEFGAIDVFYNVYRLKGNRLTVYIRLRPEVERQLRGDSGRTPPHGR